MKNDLKLGSILSEEKGQALLFSLLLSVIILLLLPYGMEFVTMSLRESHKQKAIYAQGESIAKAGIAESLSWFRRQASQPVAIGYPVPGGNFPDSAFYPLADTDTVEEDTGLVREYILDNDLNLYARYEVKRQVLNNYIDPSLTDPHAVHDITGEKLEGYYNGEGLVWYVESTGCVFVKRDPAKRYNVSPNEIVGRATVSTEFRRLTINLPIAAACILYRPGPTASSNILVYTDAKIKGGNNVGVGVRLFTPPDGLPPALGGSITGTPWAALTGGVDPTPENIFGVPKSELKLMSDYLVSDIAKLPYGPAPDRELPSIGIYYIDGNATFDADYPFNTSGILFVDGDLTIQSTADLYFTGLIYVTGTAYIYGPALISGSVIAYSKIDIRGTAGVAEIDYDGDILNSIRQQLTQYRENKAMYRVVSVLK